MPPFVTRAGTNSCCLFGSGSVQQHLYIALSFPKHVHFCSLVSASQKSWEDRQAADSPMLHGKQKAQRRVSACQGHAADQWESRVWKPGLLIPNPELFQYFPNPTMTLKSLFLTALFTCGISVLLVICKVAGGRSGWGDGCGSP